MHWPPCSPDVNPFFFVLLAWLHYVLITRSTNCIKKTALSFKTFLHIAGIGPQDHLEDVGIPTVVHSPGVGTNMQDHVAMGGEAYLFDAGEDYTEKICSFNLPKVFSTETIDLFAHNKSGPIYWLPVCEVMGFACTKYAEDQNWPDVQFFFGPYADSSDGGLFSKKASGLKDDVYTAVYEENLYKESFSILTLLMRPNSRGRVLLKDKNPDSQVLIYPNYFDDPQDVKILVGCVHLG